MLSITNSLLTTTILFVLDQASWIDGVNLIKCTNKQNNVTSYNSGQQRLGSLLYATQVRLAELRNQ